MRSPVRWHASSRPTTTARRSPGCARPTRCWPGCTRWRPGFRPALFHSPYEACVWSVLSARRQRRQAIGLRRRLCEQHGTAFELAGQTLHALPTPRTLARLDHVESLQDVAVPRLHAIAEAATGGRLDVDRLTAMPPEDAMADLQELPGIGPFYSALVVVRACGLTDVLPTEERHSRQAVRGLYDLDHEPDDVRADRDRRSVAAVPHLGHRDPARALPAAAGVGCRRAGQVT